MSQLLISVKNVEEALIALDAGVDLIDLKDPGVGALGALDLEVSKNILQAIHQYKQTDHDEYFPLTSATVGEIQADFSALNIAIQAKMDIGVDIIKIAASDLLKYLEEIKNHFDLQQVKLIAVFFAGEPMDLNVLQKLKDNDFYGAMLDTQNKQQNLLEICTLSTVEEFIQSCQHNKLMSGLAGSLKPQHIEQLADINPSYMGFRGGACENDSRINGLIQYKVLHIKNMLREHNKINGLAQQAWVCVA